MIDSHIIKPKSLKLNFVLNTTRTVLNFLVPVIIFPYVSRILGPDGLGKVDFANSIVSYFALFTALGIPVYGMREIARVRDDEKLRSQTVCELAVILAITVCAGYLIYIVLINFVPQMENQKKLFLIVAPTIFLSSFSFDWFYQGIENQTYITVRYIIVKLTQIVCIFLLVKSRGHFLRYAAILVGMGSISSICNIVHLRKFLCFVSPKNLNPSHHIKPVMIIFASLVAINIYTHVDITMIGFINGERSVGLYSAANKVITIVTSLVIAFSTVIIPRLENSLKNGNEETYKKYLNLSLHYILLLAFPSCFGIFCLAPEIIQIFAGQKYLDSVLTLKLLSFKLLVSPLSYFVGMHILYPRRKEFSFTISVSVAAIINLLCNIFLIPLYKQNGAVIATLISEIVCFVMELFFAKKNINDSTLFSANTLKYLFSAVLMFCFIYFLPFETENVIFHSFFSIFFGVIVYITTLYFLREPLLMSILRKRK